MAVVLSSVTGHLAPALVAAGGALLYVVAVLAGVRRVLDPLASAAERTDSVPTSSLVTALCLLAIGAWFTDFIGIHSVFGAFILGVAVPRGVLSRGAAPDDRAVDHGALRAVVFRLLGPEHAADAARFRAPVADHGAVFVAACAAKGGACWAAARLSGAPPRQAMAIGTLMKRAAWWS